jgi:hypothetical protein
VKEADPATFAFVRNGTMTLNAAERKIAPPQPEPTEDDELLALVDALEAPAAALRRRMDEIKRALGGLDSTMLARRWKILQSMRVAVQELADRAEDLDSMLALVGPDEVGSTNA